VWTNLYVTAGAWTVRKEVVESNVGMYLEDIEYDHGKPGSDTYYGWRMLKETDYKLCTTEYDLVWHRGTEFMKGKFKHKYDSDAYGKDGIRLY
jgi:hypothetical protein